MTAYNVVRFRTKPGKEDAFLEAHRKMQPKLTGLRKASIIKTGDRAFCFVGEWDSMASIAGARPTMISMLDSFRDTLDDLGNGMGLTDPVSGEVVLDLKTG